MASLTLQLGAITAIPLFLKGRMEILEIPALRWKTRSKTTSLEGLQKSWLPQGPKAAAVRVRGAGPS